MSSSIMDHTDSPASTHAGPPGAVAGKYLTFALGRESYGVEVLKVREIIRMQEITAVPRMPAYVKGVINLRGKVIPVIDLRVKFQLAEAGFSERTCIIVVQTNLPAGDKAQMGLIVDAVEEVLPIIAEEIEAPPDFGARLATDYILGMAKLNGAVKALLDIDRVIAADTLIAQVQGSAVGKT